MGIDEVFFGHLVSPQRAEYLDRCLDEPLCTACGREEAECSADPCAAVQHDRDAMVTDEEISQEKYVLDKGNHCPACNSVNFEGGFIEVAAGSAHQLVHCHDCSAAWYDQYTLKGYRLTEEGGE